MAEKPTYEELEKKIQELEKVESKRKQAEEALKKSEENYKITFNNLQVGVIVHKGDGSVIFSNPVASHMLGLTDKQILGKELIDPSWNFVNEDLSIMKVEDYPVSRVIATEQKLDFYQVGIQTKGRNYITWVIVNANPVFSDNELDKIIVNFANITDRKQAEEALRTNQYYLEKAQELGRIGTWELDLKKNILRWTDENCKIFGVHPGSVVNYEIFLSKVHPDDREYVDQEWLAGIAGKPYDIEHRLLVDGVTTWVREKADVEFDEDGVAVNAIGFTQDITDRKQAEEALWESEKQLRVRNRIADIFLTIPDDEMYGEVLQVVLEAMESPYGTFAYIDENGDRVVPSMTRDIWDECRMPDKGVFFPRDKWGNALWARCLREKKSFSSNGPFNIPDGHMLISRALATPIIYKGESIGNLMVGDKVTDYAKKDIALLEVIADRIAPILHIRLLNERHKKKRKQAEAELKRYQDHLEELITERTKDLNDAQEQLVRSEKLAALGKLTGILGHEIKTPLSVIKNSFEFLKIRLDQTSDEKIPKHLNIVLERLKVIDNIFDNLFDFVRAKKLKSNDIDPEKLVEDTLRDIPVPANIKIVRDLGSGLPRITVDEIQIQQAFHNIISNALDAMDEGGTLTVSTGNQAAHEMEQGFVTISFKDTGEGISKDHSGKIFEPLFTTKSKGTGLGLAACENIIRAHKGSIEVSSEMGEGSTFTVKLPV